MINKFIKELKTWLGTPYQHWGMEKGKAADCSLFIACALKEIGVLRRVLFKYYKRTWQIFDNQDVLIDHIENIIPRGFAKGYKFIRVGKPKKGDLLIFALRNKCNHMAVYLDNGKIIHSKSGKGVIIDNLDKWKTKLKRIYRIWGLSQQ